jgi:acyl dehydratase
VNELAERLAVGDQLPTFTRVTDFANWNRYAAVNDEFVPIHMDDEAGRAAGVGGAIGMGNLQWSYLHNLVRDWVGDHGRILSMDCQFRSTNQRGQTVTAKGTVTDVSQGDGGLVVTLNVWTETAEGQQLAAGQCSVLLD